MEILHDFSDDKTEGAITIRCGGQTIVFNDLELDFIADTLDEIKKKIRKNLVILQRIFMF